MNRNGVIVGASFLVAALIVPAIIIGMGDASGDWVTALLSTAFAIGLGGILFIVGLVTLIAGLAGGGGGQQQQQQVVVVTRPDGAGSRFCTECGSGLKGGERFCTGCGTQV